MGLLTAKSQHRLIVLIRIFLGLIFFTAGMSKLYADNAFPGVIGPVWLEERLAEHQLGMYARFIAGSQVVAGLLLFTQRFATLGAILNFPIILNIFMVTVSMKWQGTPYINFFLLSLNAWLLAYDYPKLKFILTDEPAPLKNLPLKRKQPRADMIWALAVTMMLLSILASQLNHVLAWTMCAAGVLTVVLNQLSQNHFKKYKAVEEHNA